MQEHPAMLGRPAASAERSTLAKSGTKRSSSTGKEEAMSEVASVDSPAAGAAHPIQLIVTDDLRRSRLTVFFRLLLVIPHLIWLALWGIAAEILLLVAWIIGIFMGYIPDGIHNFLAGYVRYATRVTAYILLLANPFPPFSASHPYAVDAQIALAAPQSRLGIFFRLILAIPAIVLTYVFRIVNNVIAFLMWFYALITGQANEGMRNLSVWLLRYETQTYGYIFLLTSRYPSLSGAPTV
jgi:Domain of unknown function (DUF4389)